MLRYLWIILFFLVLAIPFALRHWLVKPEPELKGQTAGRLVIVTPNNQDIRREFARAFDQWHQEHFGESVKIDWRVPGGSNDIKRLLESVYAAQRLSDGRFPDEVRADIDLVWGGGDYLYDVELNPLGLLQPLDLSPELLREAFPEPLLAGVKLRDVRHDAQGRLLPPRWVGICLSGFGIVYNPAVYSWLHLPPPQTWTDLARPQLAGLLALADPTRSGSAAVAYMVVVQRAMADAEAAAMHEYPDLAGLSPQQRGVDQRYTDALARGWHEGMRQLLLIAANARYFTDSANLVPRDVSSGDAAAGVAIDFYGRTFQEVVGSSRIRFVSPRGATAITPDPVAILLGVKGEQKVLAERFVTFLLSRQGQLLWIVKPGLPDGPLERGLRRLPIRPDVYADRTNWTDDADPFVEADGFNQRGEWMSLFSDMRPLWAAAWIDSRETLKQAYAAILHVSEVGRRDRLMGELTNLPVQMNDVVAVRAQRAAMQRNHQDITLWQTRQRIEWARKFREHYQRVTDEARR